MKLVKFSSRFSVPIILLHHLNKQLVVVHENDRTNTSTTFLHLNHYPS